MRAQFKLTALKEMAYDHTYHHKLRGRFWRGLKGTDYAHMHDDAHSFALCYSNPFPRRSYSEGDEVTVIVSSPHPGVIDTLIQDANQNPEFNIGNMNFRVHDAFDDFVDAGKPGESAIMQSSVGVYIPITKADRDTYDIETKYDADKISWTPEYGLEPFKNRITENLLWKYESLSGHTPPEFTFNELFETIELGNTYALELPVATNYEKTIIVTQCRLKYHIKNDLHRKIINTAYETGIGARNRLGLGFVNKCAD